MVDRTSFKQALEDNIPVVNHFKEFRILLKTFLSNGSELINLYGKRFLGGRYSSAKNPFRQKGGRTFMSNGDSKKKTIVQNHHYSSQYLAKYNLATGGKYNGEEYDYIIDTNGNKHHINSEMGQLIIAQALSYLHKKI